MTEQEINQLTAFVHSKKKYQKMHTGLIRMIAEQECEKGRGMKKTRKAILGKLHQIGAAYFKQTPDYSAWEKWINALPDDLHARETRETCIRIMQHHHSTHERQYILEDFFQTALAPIQPVGSILDLACGLNPLALPWMPIKNEVQYYGCDIFEDMMQFLNGFADHFGFHGNFHTCNILDLDDSKSVDVAFLLKTLPCLEQVQKGFAPHLLEKIPAKHILISYPVSSLSGKNKGMEKTYTDQFKALIQETGWTYAAFTFSSEIAFLVEKG